MSAILIKNGSCHTASSSFRADIKISDGKIQAVGANLTAEKNSRIIDASEFYVFPGGVDPHVHMELPVGGTISCDDFRSGTRAAIAGGTTTLIDFVTPARGDSLIASLKDRKEQARKSICDYGFHMSITFWNQSIVKEMSRCVIDEGITSFKTYMAYKESIGLQDEDLIAAMDSAAQLGALVTIHCEHGDVIRYLQQKFISQGKTEPKYHPLSRPPAVEGEAVQRALLMASTTGCTIYIVHVSTEDALQEIATAHKRGQTIFAETCPQYLLLDEFEYDKPDFGGAAYVMSPPLRAKKHQSALWNALQKNVIRTVATDHCPFNMKGQKEMGRENFSKIPNGVAGVENRLSLMYAYGVLKNRISINQFVDLCCTQPAKIFGLYPQKGSITVGADADLVLWDPQNADVISAKTQKQNCDTNIYEGFKIKGQPNMVILRGEIVYESGAVLVEEGFGKYLYRKKGM